MGLLDGGAAALFGNIMNQYFLDAVLHQYGEPIYTDGIITGNTGGDVAVKAQKDSVTHDMRGDDDYIEGDVRILVVNPGFAPTTDDEITVLGDNWKVRSVSSDPAGAYYELRGRRA